MLQNRVDVPFGRKKEKGIAAPVALNRFHVRRAAVAMLRMAQSTSDPVLAAKLIDIAAHLKEQAGELPVPFTEAPDLQPKEKE
jgi:hypothetical protein